MLVFALVVILLSVVFSVIVSYAMYLKLHSDVTSFAEESSHQSSIELMELRASLKRLHEELRSKEASAKFVCDVSLGWSIWDVQVLQCCWVSIPICCNITTYYHKMFLPRRY